jgi:citrate synthase
MTDRPKKTPEQWWETSIIDMAPGAIRFRGYAIEELIGNISFVQMIWLVTRGELPDPRAAKLLEAALVAAVDHGPQAPSIAIARMAMSCGVGINNAMASATNVLGDVHGGAGEQCVELYHAIATRLGGADNDASLKAAVLAEMTAQRAAGVSHLPGFGHRFHPIDPRAPRLLALVDQAQKQGAVSGLFARIARGVEDALAEKRGGRRIPMNIDGATAVIFAELGFAPTLCRGLFILSRSVGALAHAWEESQSGARNKGPIPRDLLPAYNGPAARKLPPDYGA